MENIPFKYDIIGLAKDMDIDLAAISNLYNEYFLEMKTNIQESQELYKSENWARLERVIHNIKGISISLNIDDIYTVSNKLDTNLKLGNYDTAAFNINNIRELFNAAENDIKEFFKQNSIRL
jgi:hypothetical protein